MVFDNRGVISSSDSGSLGGVEVHFSKYLTLRINTSISNNLLSMYLDQIMGGREKLFVSLEKKTGY